MGEQTKCERVVKDSGKAKFLGKCARIVGYCETLIWVYSRDLDAPRHCVSSGCPFPSND